VAALQQQGHRRILALTGEHPKYTFDQFLHVRARRCSGCLCFFFGGGGGGGGRGREVAA
jgi:hypothetical protein